MLRLLLLGAILSVTPSLARAQTSSETAEALGSPRGGGASQLPPPPTQSNAVPGPQTAASGLEGEAQIPLNVARRLRLLTTSLNGLAMRGRSNIGDGITSLVAAGVGFGFGALAKHNGDTRTAKYLYIFGSVGVAQAGLAFARPRATGYASRFSVMPMTTNEDVLARLEYGEQSLHHLARVHRALRFADASLSIGAALGTLPILLGSDGFDSGDEWDWVIVVSAGLSATMGIVSLVQKSDAERRWNNYAALVDELENPQRGGITLRGVAPWVTPNGFGTVTDFAF